MLGWIKAWNTVIREVIWKDELLKKLMKLPSNTGILQFCNRTNLPKVNRKEVAGFRTPLPPIELQNEFAAFVAQVNKSKVVVQKSLEQTQLLFDSLMQQYFG